MHADAHDLLSDLVDDFDHTDPRLVSNPHPVYSELRKRCPLAHGSRFGGFWVLTRYADVNYAEHDTASFSSAEGVTIPPLGNPLPAIPLEADPPIHSRYRSVLQPWFSPARMARYADDIRAFTRQTIGTFAGRGHADLAAELATPLPPLVIARILGLPESDWHTFQELTERLLDTALLDDPTDNFETAIQLLSYIQGQIEERQRRPSDDLLSFVANLRNAIPDATDDEILGTALLLTVAGHETTVGSIGMMLLHLGLNPSAKHRLVGDPSLIPSAIEESLRLDPPVPNFARTLTRDVELHGRTLRAGDRVLLVYGAANRDEAEFPDPDTLVVDRHPNRHLSFGAGVHRCLGAHLARLELRIVLEEVLAAIPDYRIEDPAAVSIKGGINRTVSRLPAVWPTA